MWSGSIGCVVETKKATIVWSCQEKGSKESLRRVLVLEVTGRRTRGRPKKS